MKRKNIEMLAIHKKDGGASMKTLNRSMLVFRDSEKVRGTLKKIFPLAIKTMIRHFDVSRVSINGGSSCYIMYSKFF